MRALLGHRLLRPIVLASTADSIFLKGIAAIFVLYATRELEISPVVLGVILAVGGVGAIPGAHLSAPAARHFGMGRTIIGGWLIGAAAWLLVPLATGQIAVPVLAANMLLVGIAGTIVNVQQWSLRQFMTPDALQGRVTASHRFLVYGAYPLGAFFGGWLGASSVCGRRSPFARLVRSPRRSGSFTHRSAIFASIRWPTRVDQRFASRSAQPVARESWRDSCSSHTRAGVRQFRGREADEGGGHAHPGVCRPLAVGRRQAGGQGLLRRRHGHLRGGPLLHLLLALFPFVIFLLTLLGALGLSDFFDRLLRQAQTALPPDAYELLAQVIGEIRQQPREGLIPSASSSRCGRPRRGCAR